VFVVAISAVAYVADGAAFHVEHVAVAEEIFLPWLKTLLLLLLKLLL